MKRAGKFFGIVLLGGAYVTSAVLSQATAQELLEVNLREKTVVVGPKVTLKDLAEIRDVSAARLQRAERLSLGFAPPPGESRVIPARLVRMELYKAGFLEKEVRVVGAQAVTVRTAFQHVSAQTLLQLLEQYIRNQISPENGEIRVEPVGDWDKEILLPEGVWSVQFRSPLHGRFEGSLLFTGEIAVDGRAVMTLPLRVNVFVEKSIVVLTQRVNRGEEINRKDVQLTKRMSSTVPNGALERIEDVIGRKAKRSLPPNTFVRWSDLIDPPAVHRGSVVRGVYRRGAVELSVDVVVLRDAKVGEVIFVRNKETESKLRAKVVDEKTVEILAQ